MTSRSLQSSSHYLQAPFVSGAPGPPVYRPPSPLLKDDDDDEMFYATSGRGELDDLGDLMQEMREGAPWVEELALDCELPLGGGAGPAEPFAPPSATPQPRLCDLGGEAPAPLQRGEEAPLQPCMAAKLMHPGGGAPAAGAPPLSQSTQMVPVALPGAGCEGDSEATGLRGPGGAPDCATQQGGWLPQPLPYYCGGASPAPSSAAAAAAFFGQPQQPQQGSPAPEAGLQTAPPAFYASPMAQPLRRMLRQDRLGSGAGGGQQSASAYLASQLMLPVGPQPHSSSGDASDGTKLHLRSSAGGNDSGSAGGGCCQGSTAPRRAPGPPPLGLEARQRRSQAPAGASFCDAPSESSDNEDEGCRSARQHSQTQVVPDLGFLAQQPFGGPGVAMPPMPAPGCLPGGTPFGAFPPMPAPCAYHGHDTPAAQTARVARQRSLERYREKKARRGFGKKIRYQARKANADKRPRVKGRFVKADEAADMLAAAAASASVEGGDAAAPPAATLP